MIKRYGDTDFVTGLRAVAALMVVMVHTMAFADFGPLGTRISGAGAAGVQAFFVISGFSIATVLGSGPSFGDFMARRMARIMPLYIVSLVAAFVILKGWGVALSGWRTEIGAPPPAIGLVLDALFLGWLHPMSANDFIGVEWSIPVEVFWYAALPIILPLLRSRRAWVLAILGTLLMSAATRIASELIFERSLWAVWAPTTFGAWFVIGAMTTALLPRVQNARGPVRMGLLTAGIGLFGLAFLTSVGLTSVFVGLGTTFVILGHPGEGARSLLTTRPVLFLGTVSYGIYLWHIFAIAMLAPLAISSSFTGFVATIIVAVILATASYALVERPAVRGVARILHKRPGRAGWFAP